jgi:hypothetical protein
MQTLRKDGTIYIEQLPLVMQNSAFYIKKLCNFSQIIIIIICFWAAWVGQGCLSALAWRMQTLLSYSYFNNKFHL